MDIFVYILLVVLWILSIILLLCSLLPFIRTIKKIFNDNDKTTTIEDINFYIFFIISSSFVVGITTSIIITMLTGELTYSPT